MKTQILISGLIRTFPYKRQCVDIDLISQRVNRGNAVFMLRGRLKLSG